MRNPYVPLGTFKLQDIISFAFNKKIGHQIVTLENSIHSKMNSNINILCFTSLSIHLIAVINTSSNWYDKGIGS